MENCLAVMHPEIVRDWSEKNLLLTPDTVTYGSNRQVWWKGACGHEWQTSIKSRSSGENCPICSGKRVVEGINDLATLEPELALEWSERNLSLTPDMINDKARKNVWWKCRKCGYEWKAVFFHG